METIVRPSISEVYEKTCLIVGVKYCLPKTKDKGKPGSFLESITGIPKSSACLDCSDGEVKTFPVKRLTNGRVVPKETIAVTMLNKQNLVEHSFAESKCYNKMKKILFVPYFRENDDITFLSPTIIEDDGLERAEATAQQGAGERLNSVDTAQHCRRSSNMTPLYEVFRDDYELIRQRFIETGTLSDTSSIGKYLQNRTKGAGGDAPKTRAFYLRQSFMTEHVPMNLSI